MTTEGGARGLVRHGRAFVELGVASVLGILATAGFQLVAINGLAPGDFGLLASFLALINVVAVGSAALRNAVAVAAAETAAGHRVVTARRDGTLVEALVLGALSAGFLAVASPWLASVLESDALAVLATAVAALPYFLFARAQGILQGSGRTRSVVWWTTGSQLATLALTALALALGGAARAILLVVVLVTLTFTIGSTLHARAGAPVLRAPAFSRGSIVVLVLTLAFAWLINADMLLVRALEDPETAGSYAAAGVLVKALLIVPATLGLYLLPRFVGTRGDAAMTRLGVNVVLGVTLASGLLLVVGVLFLGPWVVGILYPGAYTETAALLPWLAIMWVPWAAAQGLLIRVTAARSLAGLIVLGFGVATQFALGVLALPGIYEFMLVNGLLGFAVLVALFVIHMLDARTASQPEGSSEPPMPLTTDD